MGSSHARLSDESDERKDIDAGAIALKPSNPKPMVKLWPWSSVGASIVNGGRGRDAQQGCPASAGQYIEWQVHRVTAPRFRPVLWIVLLEFPGSVVTVQSAAVVESVR